MDIFRPDKSIISEFKAGDLLDDKVIDLLNSHVFPKIGRKIQYYFDNKLFTFHPSTNWSDCLILIDWLLESKDISGFYTTDDSYYVSYGCGRFWVQADTLMLAVCSALILSEELV